MSISTYTVWQSLAVAALALLALFFVFSGTAAHAQVVPITPEQARAERGDINNVMVLTSTGPVPVTQTTGVGGNADLGLSTDGVGGNADLGLSTDGVGGNADQGLAVGGVTTTATTATTIAPIVVPGPSGTYIGSGFGPNQQVRVIDRTGKDLGVYRADVLGVVVVGSFPAGSTQAPYTLIGI